MADEAQIAHDALVEVWAELQHAAGARFERRGDLHLASFPQIPIPQCNCAWVIADSADAVDTLATVLEEIAATGATPAVQTRSSHERVPSAAREMGFTTELRTPGMVVRPDGLKDAEIDAQIERIDASEVDECNGVLASSFGAPQTIFELLGPAVLRMPNATWYVAKREGEIVSTALSMSSDGAVGIFNVATPEIYRRRGYGAALTAHAAREGFAQGAEIAYLQSSAAGHKVYLELGFRDVESYVVLVR